MAPNSADSLTKRQELELARLKRGSRFSTRRLLVIGAFICVAVFLSMHLLSRFPGDRASLESGRQAVIHAAGDWGLEFSDAQEAYEIWLSRHGTLFELHTFIRLSQGLFESASGFAAKIEDPSMLGRMYLALHGGVLRVGFILLASCRLWLVVIGACIWMGLRPLRPWQGRDALGQTGNGRVFFSGVRVALDNPTPDGAPSEQVTGLACPGATSLATAKTSALAKVLEKFSAITTTNLKLIAIIQHHKDFPAYIAPPGEEAELDAFFEGTPLAENIEGILEGALKLHSAYRGESEIDPSAHVNAAEIIKAAHQGRHLTGSDNARLVIDALDRVLTPTFKEALALLDAASIATIVLALEAGKSLAFAHEGGKWVLKSNFPQLSARAVLHSIPEFGLEYDFDLRATLRRALIFGSRSSVFAPVKFPVDFRAESRAARQWVEILMATPHQLSRVADEVQLWGIVSELHQKWEKVFFEGAQALNPEVIDQVFATPQNLIFMPVTRIVKLMKRLTDATELQQLESLVTVVSQEQRQRISPQTAHSEGEEERSLIPSYERVFPPFTPQQVKALSDAHGISSEDARAWSSLRVVLHAYGWLGRRVADRSVPESSIVFAVSKVGTDFPGANAIGLLGNIAVVPLRATRLGERWGKLWGSRFMQVGNTRMAETRADFESLLAGRDDDNELEQQPTAVAQGTGTGV